MMNKLLSVLILLAMMFVMHNTSGAEPANPAMLNDIKITTTVDNTKIELRFDSQPGDEKILYRDEYVQIEIPEAYTDPAKQWLNVEDEIVKNIFVYQYDTNTVRVRLFTYGNAAGIRERISISKVNNDLIISYEQVPAVVATKAPVIAKVNAKKEVKKSKAAPVENKSREKIVKLPPPPQTTKTEPIAVSDVVAANLSESRDESGTVQLSAEADSNMHNPESLPLIPVAEEAKSVPVSAPPSFSSSVIKMVTALGIVLSLLFAVVYLVKKYLGKKIGFAGQEHKIRVITTTYLGPKKSIALVEVAGEKIVVGVTATTISMLTKLGKDEDFGEVLKEQINPESTNERIELHDELWEKV